MVENRQTFINWNFVQKYCKNFEISKIRLLIIYLSKIFYKGKFGKKSVSRKYVVFDLDINIGFYEKYL